MQDQWNRRKQLESQKAIQLNIKEEKIRNVSGYPEDKQMSSEDTSSVKLKVN